MDKRQLVKQVEDLQYTLEHQKRKVNELQSIALKHQEAKVEKVLVCISMFILLVMLMVTGDSRPHIQGDIA